MNNKRVLISGASIAGPALAYWLNHYGFEVTIVEQADSLRLGGYKIDIRGKAVEVMKKMALYQEACRFKVVQLSGSVLNEQGELIDQIPAELMGMHVGDDIELLRGELSRILYHATNKQCQYLFSTSIKALEQHAQGMKVEFNNGPEQDFDLLVGADGIHSNVRHLVFGNEAQFSHNLGDYYAAICSIETDLNLNRHEFFYSQIDKLLNLYCTPGAAAKALFVFRAPNLTFKHRDLEQQKAIVSRIYADAAWEVPHLVKSMQQSSEFYFDEVKQIRMPQWYKERTILIGDAAFSPCLASGQGTSLALVAAYVLAKELAQAKGDYASAFPQYEKEMRSFVDLNQKLGETIIEFMVPKAVVEPWLGESMLDMIRSASQGIELK
ncbi:FAD-dependent monooxygenase [Legionella sp. km772]|uniref:FAD-dependent monooxygenase n=1 Tax=Legionella sp. km772 TaxID=2498111 RepID=UPI000F8ECE9E|nr:FAD-dependent monooxygenase [Legionella sp. km772]RUR13721.1 FAD-dependent oxidoreductase [Legionella sp. km772]